jgi:hypothetical protein
MHSNLATMETDLSLAAKLNERMFAPRGGKWTHVQVGAVLRPFAEAAVAL